MNAHKTNSVYKTPLEVLKGIWGHDAFRPLQSEIVNAVLGGKDTLALLPTGGGKSICYQIPGIFSEGICIVISPLIALIKDQVEGLRQRGVKAETVHSQIHHRDIDRILDNCIYGHVKFLFISPERLSNELFQVRLARMQVSLIAVDEAHCISQWGHDFRPSYRQLSAIRELLPETPILALTATATPEVAKDIQEQLALVSPEVFSQSFSRSNLDFSVIHTEDKRGTLLNTVDRLARGSGAGIVYVRSRRKCQELAQIINDHGHTATAYHAGMDSAKRQAAQEAWMRGEQQWVVATNAFGMGIDKSDVRMVIHFDISDGIESYYQEAGRAGRDGKPAEAVQLYHSTDIYDTRAKLLRQYPEAQVVKRVYQTMSDILNLASGSGELETFGIDLRQISERSSTGSQATLGSLKILEISNLIQLHQGIIQPSSVQITATRRQIFELEESENNLSKLVQALVRTRSGASSAPVSIREEELAKVLKIPVKSVEQSLALADQHGVLDYQPRRGSSSVTYLSPRLAMPDVRLDTKQMLFLRNRNISRQEALIHYLRNEIDCRMSQLVEYFGESESAACGSCDNCKTLERNDLQGRKVKMLRHLRTFIQANNNLAALKQEMTLHYPNPAKTMRWVSDRGFIAIAHQEVKWTGPVISLGYDG